MGLTSRLKKYNRRLLLKLALMAFAFILLTTLSYIFMSASMRDSIALRATSIHELTAERITSTLRGFESALEHCADEIRVMLGQGCTEAQFSSYLESISHFKFLDGNEASGIQNFFVYFETLPSGPKLIHSSYWSSPDGYRPEEQDWFRLAIEANGGIIDTEPIISNNDETRLIYAKCIFDNKGRRLGIVCMNVLIDLMGKQIVETSLHQGGYGMLINEDDIVLFHPSPDFRGKNLYDPALPFSFFADEIDSGNVYEKPMIAYRGDKAVAFYTTLYNGWHLGLVTPQAQYYKGITRMGIIIGILAAAFAAIFIVIMARLEAAKVQSDEENRQKSAFLANMSHEIRTPINAIVGMTSIAKSAVSSSRKDYCLTKISEASRHLLSVVNDILDMSKIKANQIELSPAEFSFEGMLQQAVDVVIGRADEKSQKLTVSIDPNIPKRLFADDQRLAQIIANLLSNAIKFTPEEGAIRLKTSLLGEENGVCTIKMEVSDTGIGISEEQQAKLFQAFQQAESSTTRSYGGTGLGLAISKRIVEMMGGDIIVDSALGKGTLISFTVKAERGAAEPSSDHLAIDFKNTRILAVDDDPEILAGLQEIITRLGADCTVAQDAKEALSLVKENGDYDIYFFDLRMPRIGGISLALELRAREKKPSALVMMTSFADLTAVEQDALCAGVNMFLLKPIFPAAIADTISECVGVSGKKPGECGQNINGIFAGRHILLVEDVDINREIVMAQLEPTQIGIDCAENGAEAVEMFDLEPEKYDLIFMDIQMPKLDGYDATRRIRELGNMKSQQIPIIAMTANVFKEDVDRCLEAGMNAHIGKPVDFDEVMRVLKVCFGSGAFCA